MKQITEDYVSFEVAKLLKEKEFYTPYCYSYYFSELESKTPCISNRVIIKNTDKYLAPTLQMAMKWLREIYGLNIQVCIVRNIELNKAYNATIYDNKCEQLKSHFKKNVLDGFNSYEEAAEEAIKYCIINLI